MRTMSHSPVRPMSPGEWAWRGDYYRYRAIEPLVRVGEDPVHPYLSAPEIDSQHTASVGSERVKRRVDWVKVQFWLFVAACYAVGGALLAGVIWAIGWMR